MNAGAGPEAFDRMVEEHLDALYRYALRLCNGRRADAEDLVHDAVLRALKRRAQLRSFGSGRAWLFQIVTRTHLNRCRSAGRRAETLSSDLDEQAFEEALAAWSPLTGPEEQLLQSQQRDGLVAAMDALDPRLRAALWLTDVEEFTQREVAEMLSVPEGTVASRVFRARRALRTSLGAKERGAARSIRTGRSR
jgi:RNA polymerase sigma-70 factor (ECF subfamily)